MRSQFIFAIVAGALMITGCTKCSQKPKELPADKMPQIAADEVKELRIIDMVEGTGAAAEPGKTIKVHYTGTLFGGNKFDSSRDRNEPFEFVLGAGQVIRGWDMGIVGMKVGGRRQLIIPPQLAYGDRGEGGVIPPNSILVFDVELLEVK